MIEEVVSVDLAVHERLTVRKNRLAPKQLTGNEKRISIVTGTHGDELDATVSWFVQCRLRHALLQ